MLVSTPEHMHPYHYSYCHYILPGTPHVKVCSAGKQSNYSNSNSAAKLCTPGSRQCKHNTFTLTTSQHGRYHAELASGHVFTLLLNGQKPKVVESCWKLVR